MLIYSGILLNGQCISGVCQGVSHIYISGAKTFEDSFKEIESIVERKRYEYTFDASKESDFDDFKWETIQHINIKWDLYNQTRPLGGWVKTIVDNLFINMLRDKYLGTASPCNTCKFAQGDDLCGEFGEQKNMQCPVFSKWYSSNKRHKHIARLPVTIENKMNEISNVPDFSVNIESAIEEFHIKIKDLLTKSEWEIYHCLYVSGMTEEETAKKLGFKTSEAGKTAGYKRIRNVKKIAKTKGRELLKNEGLDRQFF